MARSESIFAGANAPSGEAVFFRVAHSGHTDFHVTFFEYSYVIGGGALHALLRVMDFRRAAQRANTCQSSVKLAPGFRAYLTFRSVSSMALP